MLEFKLGHQTFQFQNDEFIIYYPWLNHLFGNGSIYNPTKKLKYNLIEYLKDVEPYIIRNMIESISYLQQYYNEKENKLDNLPKDKLDFIHLTETFLIHGPGVTKGIDVCYKCIKCNLETKDKKNIVDDIQVMPHNFIRTNSNGLICTYCGIQTEHNTDINICIINKEKKCQHAWD